jgi:hypothetical protein
MKPIRRRRVSRTQLGVAFAPCLSALGPLPIQSQSPFPKRSPKEVLEAYRKMDAQGERLTPRGWNIGSTFFAGPVPSTWSATLAVTSGETVEDPNPWFKEKDKAEIFVVCKAIGQVDSLGRFTPMVDPPLIDPSGRPSKPPPAPRVNGPAPVSRQYILALTDTHWERGPQGQGLQEVKGPPEWRIETF